MPMVADESSPATPHRPWRSMGVAMSVCGAVAFVLAVYKNPSAHGGSVTNADTELVKAMNDVSASYTPKPGAHDKARAHLIQGDDADDYEAEEPEAMSSCGKGATCAPTAEPTWRAHDGVSPTVALTPFPTQTWPPTKPVQVHKATPAPQPVWHFPTKAPTTSEPTLDPTPTPAPTHHKAPSYDWPTYEPTIVPTTSVEPTGNVHGNTPKPTHKPSNHNTPKPTHKHYEPTPVPSRHKKPAHGAPTQAPTLKPTHHKAPTPEPKDDTSSPTMKPTHHKAPTPEPKSADDDDGTAVARRSGHGHGTHAGSSSSSSSSSSSNSNSHSGSHSGKSSGSNSKSSGSSGKSGSDSKSGSSSRSGGGKGGH